jgi:N-acetylglucosamine repressor
LREPGVAFLSQLAFHAGMRIADQTANRLRVIKAIRTHAPLSRSNLPALTGLSRGTITQVVGDLVDRGFLIEAKEPAKRRAGRPRTFLQINPHGGVVIGVSLSSTGMLRAAFVDLAGTKLYSIDVPLKYPEHLEDFADDIASALESAIENSRIERKALSRVGIAIPALVDARTGIVHRVAIFPDGAVPFSDLIGAYLDLPVTVEHEMVSMARAEHWFGRAQELNTFSLIYVGLYVGSADFDDGLPRLGSNGFNSEVGHTKTGFGPDAPQCFCGHFGCVSAFSSVFGMISEWIGMPELTAATISGLPGIFHKLIKHAAEGDQSAVAVIERAGAHLGIAIANHINTRDPGTIFMISESAELHAALAATAQRVVERNVQDSILRRTNIVFGVAAREWRWRGAAALALEKLYLEDAEAAGSKRPTFA